MGNRFYAFGLGGSGQLGLDGQSSTGMTRTLPVPVAKMSDLGLLPVAVAAGADFTILDTVTDDDMASCCPSLSACTSFILCYVYLGTGGGSSRPRGWYGMTSL